MNAQEQAAPPNVDWTPAVETDEPLDDSGLGAAVLPEFADAAGLETIAQQSPPSRSRRARDTVAEQPSALTVDMLRQVITHLDRTVSILGEVPQEDEKYLSGVAESCYPLANHFAAKSESVVAMAIFAGLSLLSYAVVKYQRFRERIRNAEQEA